MTITKQHNKTHEDEDKDRDRRHKKHSYTNEKNARPSGSFQAYAAASKN